MKSKKFISVAVLLLFILSMLTACGIGSSGNNTGTGDSSEKTTRTKKTELAKAAQNYEDEDVKKSTVTVTLDGAVYGHIGQSAISVSGSAYGFGVKIDIDRIENGSSYYLDADIAATKDSADGIGSMFSVFSSVNNEETLIYTLQCFFNNDITLYAKYGAEDGNYNLKGGINVTDGTHIADNVEKSFEKSDFWIADSEENIADYISDLSYGLIQPDTGTDLSSYLMKTVYTGLTKDSLLYGEDTANGYNDKKKVGEHKISLDTEELTSYLLSSSSLSSLPIKMDKYIATISSWIDIESDANVHAYTNDKMPKSITTTFNVNINIKLQELISMIDSIRLVTSLGGKATEKIDSALTELRKVASTLKDITTHTDGKTEGYFGMTLNVKVEENFSFAEDDCKLTTQNKAVDTDMFLAASEKKEGRYSIEEYLRILTSVNVEEVKEELLAYIEKYYSDVKDDAESALNDAIKGIGETITADEWETIKKSVLKNLVPDVQFDSLDSYVDEFCTTYDIKLSDEQKTLVKTTIRNFITKNYTVISRSELEDYIRETVNGLTSSDTTKLEEKLSEWMKKLK